MSIELMIHGRCEGCPGRDLELIEPANGDPPEVRCRNLDLCQHIERHILEHPPRMDMDAWRYL